ncbi:ComEC/Rec2 family competence protein [Aliiruegeria haliotis]|nr:ComEC/Rec2 family competence protein [Aliiruegeria haliotis]
MLAQRGTLLLWVPVFLAVGVSIWFALRVEPGAGAYWAAGLAAAFLLLLGLRAGDAVSPFFLACCLVLAGFLLAGARAHLVSAPVLGFRYYGPIEGRIVALDRSSSDKPRLTLDRVVLADMHPDRVPRKVRISLHGAQGFVVPEPGLTVILTGHLSSPSGPVEPGGFDFRRMVWFKSLGAVGYTRTPVLVLAPAEEGRAGLGVFRTRMALSEAIRSRVPGDAGGFAAAILAGDRSAMDHDVVEALRNSNMAHLLAISGLHMGLLTGVVFAGLRAILSLYPWLALRFAIKKIAAMAALAAGAGYLALSGGSVSTERALVMVAVMFGAVLLDRRAVSLRSVAIAATLLLCWSPEALFGPGFQMSFAATTGLVAVFGWLRDHPGVLARVPRWGMPALTVLISSAVAGAATAPFGAAHFNRIADYGLIANLFSVPVMGALVMPSAVVAAVMAPFGLEWIPLSVLRLGLEWILLVAETVSGWEGAVTHVVAPGRAVLPCLSLGVLVFLIWRGRGRFLGLAGVAVAGALWLTAERPPVLIADTGGLVGVMGPEGRTVSKPRGDGFSALTWLENDGDGADQATAAGRPGFVGPKGDRTTILDGGVSLRHLTGRGAVDRLQEGCGADIVVINTSVERLPRTGCRLVTPETLRRSGALAVWPEAEGVRILSVRDTEGARMWSP